MRGEASDNISMALHLVFNVDHLIFVGVEMNQSVSGLLRKKYLHDVEISI